MPVVRTALGFLLVGLLLAGCAALPPEDLGEGLAADDVDQFSLQGKVAWRHPEERGNANLTWTQVQDHYRLLLSGPLGQGAVTVDGAPGIVRVSSARGEQYADSADALLEDALGFSVPVSEARWWVLGLAAPGGPRTQPGAEGITQNGWRVGWSNWRQVDAYAVPRRIELSRDDLQLTFVITAWDLDVDDE